MNAPMRPPPPPPTFDPRRVRFVLEVTSVAHQERSPHADIAALSTAIRATCARLVPATIARPQLFDGLVMHAIARVYIARRFHRITLAGLMFSGGRWWHSVDGMNWTPLALDEVPRVDA